MSGNVAQAWSGTVLVGEPHHDVQVRYLPRVTLGQVLPSGLTLDRPRQDRILDEAFATGDPLKLMRLFGINEQTAMRYVGTAYPERTANFPR